MGLRQLKIGDRVNAFFLGSPIECEVIEVVQKDLYKLRSIRNEGAKSGTIFPNVKWKKAAAVNKKGEITAPWYIHSKIKNEK